MYAEPLRQEANEGRPPLRLVPAPHPTTCRDCGCSPTYGLIDGLCGRCYASRRAPAPAVWGTCDRCAADAPLVGGVCWDCTG
jgi:hypothetical protein